MGYTAWFSIPRLGFGLFWKEAYDFSSILTNFPKVFLLCFQCINIGITNKGYTDRACLPMTIWVYLCRVMFFPTNRHHRSFLTKKMFKIIEIDMIHSYR